MINQIAPDFILNDQYGNQFKLWENLGKPIVLVFYPKDDSLVCTKQLCSYNSQMDELDIDEGIIVGISADTIEEHKKFSLKNGFKFRILSDTDKQVCKLYQALNLFGMVKRKIVFIDKEGIIKLIDERLSMTYMKFVDLLASVKNIK